MSTYTASLYDVYSYGIHGIAVNMKHPEASPTKRVFECRVRLLEPAGCRFSLGFGRELTYEPAYNSITFEYDDAISVNFRARNYSEVTAAETETDTGVAADTNWHIFRFEQLATTIKFYIDGVLVAIHTTNLPPLGLDTSYLDRVVITLVNTVPYSRSIAYEYVAVWAE